jgi:carboxyl-terminal processing protease
MRLSQWSNSQSSRSRPAVLVIAGMVIGAGLSMGYTAWAARTGIPWQEARLFAEVFERVQAAYVDDVADRQLAESAARGMTSSLDQHSMYLDREEYEELRMSTSGAYAGVGVQISLDEGSIKIMGTLDDSPASKSGLRVGDVIVAVDDIPVDAEHLDESVDRIRGKPGTRVKLTVNRLVQGEPVHFMLTRRTVQVHSVQHQELEPGYGYVRITQFSETTAADFDTALTTLQNNAAQSLRGLVLDLRGNPGGVLEAATHVADAMLDTGTIVTADGRTPDARFAVQAQPGDLLKGAPIAVLVDGSSASAAEIVAGALKDHKRGVLIGQTTYGKGSVQTVMPLSDGGALKLTTSRYHTPSGATIQARGIAPDVVSTNATATAPYAAANAAPLLTDGDVRLALATLKHTKNTAAANAAQKAASH